MPAEPTPPAATGSTIHAVQTSNPPKRSNTPDPVFKTPDDLMTPIKKRDMKNWRKEQHPPRAIITNQAKKKPFVLQPTPKLTGIKRFIANKKN